MRLACGETTDATRGCQEALDEEDQYTSVIEEGEKKERAEGQWHPVPCRSPASPTTSWTAQPRMNRAQPA